MIIISHLLNAAIQLLVFTFIPFIIFLISHKTSKGFFKRIGLYPAQGRYLLLGIAIGVLIGVTGILWMNFFPILKETATGKGTVPAVIRQLNNTGEKILLIIIVALIKTALAEEVLFRGWLAKWLIYKLGYQYGNILQAVLFGAIHILLFWGSVTGACFFIFSFLISATGAYLAALINERVSKGSILPGWLMHGTANILSYTYLIFL